MTLDDDSVIVRLSYASKTSVSGGKGVSTATFITESEKLAWLN